MFVSSWFVVRELSLVNTIENKYEKNQFLIIIIIFLSHFAHGQNYREDFLKHLKAQDSLAQIDLLKKWESESPDDPELFVSYFNHFFMQGKKEVLTLNAGNSDGEGIQIKDSTGVVGHIGSAIMYDRKTVDKGIAYINKGIEKYPSRLDMRFGKIYTYGQMEDWEAFTQEIIETVSYSAEIDNHWTWAEGEVVEDAENFFLSGIQNYQRQLSDTQDDALLSNMRRIAEKVLVHYPKDVPSLSNISVSYLLTEEYDKGLEPLLKAQKIAPKDPIAMMNIARAYVLKGENKKAIKYYKKVLKYGEEQEKAYAEAQIEELKKG